MSFISTYFLDPICTGEGYNVFNTLAYGLLLIGALYLILLLFRRYNISLSPKTYLALMPFILLGPTVRVMVDGGFYPKLFLFSCFTLNTSPGIYLLAGIPAIIFALVSRWLQSSRGFSFNKSLFAFGSLYLLFIHAVQYPSAGVSLAFNFRALFIILALAVVSIGIFFFLAKYYMPFFTQKLPLLLVSAHLFDASTTFTGVFFYKYVEQHVLPNFLIGIFGPFAIYALKLLVVPFVVKAVSSAEKDERELLYFAIFVLGVGPGLRNLLRIVIGV